MSLFGLEYRPIQEGVINMGNRNLQAAKANKNDEFYTKLEDIEAEINKYMDSFKGKVVYCNCDDPYESNFFKYFV